MSLFGKLFGKKENEQDLDLNQPQTPAQDNDEDLFETPYGVFDYDPSPAYDPPEFGYGGDIDWYDKDNYPYEHRYITVGVYLECNTPDTRDFSKSYNVFLRIMSFKERTDAKIKTAIADAFANDNGMVERPIGEPITKEEFFKNLEIIFFHIYPDGDAVFSVNHHSTLSLNHGSKRVRATLKSDGEVTVDTKLQPN